MSKDFFLSTHARVPCWEEAQMSRWVSSHTQRRWSWKSPCWQSPKDGPRNPSPALPTVSWAVWNISPRAGRLLAWSGISLSGNHSRQRSFCFIWWCFCLSFQLPPPPLCLSIFHSMSHHHFNLQPCRDRGDLRLWQVETYSRPQSWNSDESGGHNYTQIHLSSKTMRFPQLDPSSK